MGVWVCQGRNHIQHLVVRLHCEGLQELRREVDLHIQAGDGVDSSVQLVSESLSRCTLPE